MIWGANPTAAGVHLVPYVYEAQRRGAKLVVVDPRRTPLARRADLHLARAPGDRPVPGPRRSSAGSSRTIAPTGSSWPSTRPDAEELRQRAEAWTLEKAAAATGLAAADIETFARLYAETRPAVVRCGWGLERNRNGGSAAAAVIALPAVAGAFGVRGGGYTLVQLRGLGPLDRGGHRRAGGRDTRGEHEPRGRGAGSGGPRPRQAALRLQLQPPHDASEPGARAARPAAGRPLHGGLRPGAHGHRPLRRHGAAGLRLPGAAGDREGLRRLRAAGPGGGGAAGRGGAGEPRGLRRAVPADGRGERGRRRERRGARGRALRLEPPWRGLADRGLGERGRRAGVRKRADPVPDGLPRHRRPQGAPRAGGPGPGGPERLVRVHARSPAGVRSSSSRRPPTSA